MAEASAANGTADPRGPARVATVSALIVVASFVASKAARDAILLASFKVTALPLFIGISAAPRRSSDGAIGSAGSPRVTRPTLCLTTDCSAASAITPFQQGPRHHC